MTDIGAIPQATIMDLMTSGLVNLTIPIIDDEVLEYTESVIITLPDIAECSGTFPSVINLLVEDDDGMRCRQTILYSHNYRSIVVQV